MDSSTERQILYIHEHKIKDVCKIGIGTIDRAKKAYQYQNNDTDSQKNKLAIFSFENTDALTIEKICKQVLKRINSTEFYVIEFYKACLLFTLIGGKLDESNSQYIDRSKISVKIATPSIKNSIPLSQRFADLIKMMVENYSHLIQQVKIELNNNGKRNVLLTKEEFDIYNKDGNRTGWKSYNELWYYRTGVDATTMSNYIKIVERKVYK
jgi:hypothetical protein